VLFSGSARSGEIRRIESRDTRHPPIVGPVQPIQRHVSLTRKVVRGPLRWRTTEVPGGLAAEDVGQQVTDSPGDGRDRWRVRLFGRVIEQEVAHPGLAGSGRGASWAYAPGARDRLPAILLVGQAVQTRSQRPSPVVHQLEAKRLRPVGSIW
jgi:hypothetical protein